MPDGWRLIERESEYASVRAALTGSSDGCGIVLTGEPGVGKTTLARLALGELDLRARWVAGTQSARSIPLGVFAHLVGTSTSSDPIAYLAAARESLLGDGHLVIGVDDAHLLDELSATLLHQLAIDRAVRIVATVRSGETVPDAITSLWKDHHLLRLTLSAFTREQSIALLEVALGGQLEGLSADRMWEASGGNALFLRHLVQGARESGALRQVDGIWQLRGRAGVTSELASLLEGRVDQLDDDVLGALKILTLCEPIDLDVLAELTSEEAIDRAELAGLVRITEEGDELSVSYAHPLFGEVIRRRVGRVSSRRLRGQLVRALRSRELRTTSDRIRLAGLTLDSDERAEQSLLLAAAHDSTMLADVASGERFARAALDAGGGLEAAVLLARALMWQGDAQGSDRVLVGFDPETLGQVQVVRWGLQRIGNLFWCLGDAQRADQVIDQVRRRVTEPALRSIVDGIESVCAVFENDLPRAFELSERVLAAPDSLPWAVEWAVFGGGFARALAGRGNEVAALAERGRIAEVSTDGVLRFPAGIGEILALTLTGSFEAADAAARRYVDMASAGQYLAWAMAGIHVGTVSLARGDLTAAIPQLEQSLAALAGQRRVSWAFPAKYTLIQAYSALGIIDSAQRMLVEAEESNGLQVAVFEPQLILARAHLAAATGMVGSAIDTAVQAARCARSSGQFAVEATALHTAVRFGGATAEIAHRLTELVDVVDGPLVAGYARHATAAVAGDAGALDACAAEYERIGALLSAADTAAAASTLHDAVRERTATAAAAATAIRLAAACGGLRTPAVIAAAQPLPLTPREREVATLVAAGLSNKDIAGRLVLSVRTVEGHILRACTKLGVGDRGALGAFLSGGREAP